MARRAAALPGYGRCAGSSSPPLCGRWVIPGGTVELGEPLEEALVREMREETGLEVQPLEVLTVFDRIERDGERVVYHYVIVDYLCYYESGAVLADSDVACAEFVRLDALHSKKMAPGTPPVIREALALRERLAR